MGKAKDALVAFIAAIPANKLSGFGTQVTTIYSNDDFRLDMQSATPITQVVEEKDAKGKTKKVTKTIGYKHNLQIQANRQSGVTSVKKIAPRTVAGPVLVEQRDGKAPSMTAEQVRQGFKDKMLI